MFVCLFIRILFIYFFQSPPPPVPLKSADSFHVVAPGKVAPPGGSPRRTSDPGRWLFLSHLGGWGVMVFGLSQILI